MGSFSDLIENKILEHAVGKTQWTFPTNVYVGLFTSACSDASPGTEVSGGSYARKQTSGADWSAASGGALSNAVELAFVEATDAWGLVTHFALFDAASGGTYIGWGTLGTSKQIDSGDQAKFAAGDLDLTQD